MGAGSRAKRIGITVEWVMAQFEQFYNTFLEVPYQAKDAFERQHHGTSIWLSRYRLSLYSSTIHQMVGYLNAVQPDIATDSDYLHQLEDQFWHLVESRYEADVAYAFMHSIRRAIYRDEWKPVEYSFWGASDNTNAYPEELVRSYAVKDTIDVGLVEELLLIPEFSTAYQKGAADSAAISRRINRLAQRREARITGLEMINAGFYRNRGAYLVGKIGFEDESYAPLIIALLNNDTGIYCDAVILDQHLTHNLFSSTLANFHVTTRYYHELSAYLHSIMPQRALGLNYSTIGYNHIGKVAVIKELKQ